MDLQAKLQYLGSLEGFKEVYSLDQKVTTIGRGDESDIVLFPQSNPWFPTNLSDPDKLAVSRVHAKIVKKGNEFYIEDLGSLVGTYVNGVKLGKNSIKELYDEFPVIAEADPWSDNPIRSGNRGKIRLEDGDKITLGEEIFSDNSRYQFVFKTQ